MFVVAVLVTGSSMKPSVRMPNCSGVDLVINWVSVKLVAFSVTVYHMHNSYYMN